ncbi:hypothetical protein AKJ44_02580 [candidate division MSBL1 archaeon SCGC-AAA261F17]|uniref:Type II toxin-antitoxin system HicA family toxin n=1 Tax=candidate division MSBL1 archaeon SCGC-AAA261F17 TaxID=1698274 RepID=A0A133V4N4_9EURY|nr:hypothetical protein AKJ44_02580 [candidate division MSBL1 archaeon SCGC-AAA261F17]
MSATKFSGLEVVKALVRNRFQIVGRTGSHVKLRYEHPTNKSDIRIVIVPMYDSVDTGTLRSIANQAGARDFQKFKKWIDRNR